MYIRTQWNELVNLDKVAKVKYFQKYETDFNGCIASRNYFVKAYETLNDSDKGVLLGEYRTEGAAQFVVDYLYGQISDPKVKIFMMPESDNNTESDKN